MHGLQGPPRRVLVGCRDAKAYKDSCTPSTLFSCEVIMRPRLFSRNTACSIVVFVCTRSRGAMCVGDIFTPSILLRSLFLPHSKTPTLPFLNVSTMSPIKFMAHSLCFRHPTLGDQPPHNASYIPMPSCGPCTAWNIHIKRTGAQLEVSVDLWGPNKDIAFQSISLVPFKGGKHWNSSFDKRVLQAGHRVKGRDLFCSIDDFYQ